MAQGGALTVPTLLGRAAPRIPVAGRTRAGVNVLTRRAAENERVRAIYECGVGQGKSFDTIKREIADAAPDLKNPLTPKNVPYRARRGLPREAILHALEHFEPAAGHAPKGDRVVSADEIARAVLRIRGRSAQPARDVALFYTPFVTGARPLEIVRLRPI